MHNKVYEYVIFFEGQVYDWGRFQNTVFYFIAQTHHRNMYQGKLISGEKLGSSPFLSLKYVPRPMTQLILYQVNPTSGKLGQKYFKIENSDDQIIFIFD